MTAGPRECRRLIIRGRVQGVGYRAWVAEQAIAAGLAGWVRNRRDGSVEAVLAGAPEAVMAMTAACRRGPAGARVDNIAEEAIDAAALGNMPAGEAFVVLPTC